MNVTVEYVWIDASNKLRSKCRVLVDISFETSILGIPNWDFDGSSTGQALSDNSDIHLVPRCVFRDPFRTPHGIIVMCDCYKPDGTPVENNYRFRASEIMTKVSKFKPLFGIEQEYVLYSRHTGKPIFWPGEDSLKSRRKYYCGVGTDNVYGRDIAEEHLWACLDANVKICGINSEAMPSQWKFQIGPCESVDAGDHLWIARYLLYRIAEKYGVLISFESKPEKGEWNGSGLHTNFSTKEMRSEGGLSYIYNAIEKLEKNHKEHIAVYGNTKERLTGTCETSSYDHFTYGVGDRTASIRIPTTVKAMKCGYFEDRRPSADADPYRVTTIIAETILCNGD